jgi:hypothetical protein
VARGKFLCLEQDRQQKQLIKLFGDEYPYEGDGETLIVEALAKSGIQTVAEMDIAPRRAALDKLMG